MAHLKDPNRQIPGGLQFRQAATNWDSTKQLPRMPSLTVLTNAVIAMRKGNPHLTQQHGWSTDPQAVMDEVNRYNAERCLQNGWSQFVSLEAGASAPPKTSPSPYPPSNAARVAAAVKAGAKTLTSWIGEGGKPVERIVAEKRAAICATCKFNDSGDWSSYFTEPVSRAIHRQIEVKNELHVITSRDAELRICKLCLCPLKLKVHVPLDHILKNIGEEVKATLPEWCWIIAK